MLPLRGLFPTTGFFGLPQKIFALDPILQPDSIKITATNLCLGSATTFTISGNQNYPGLTWDFGDIASGSTNTSTSLSPTHIFSGTGDFTVKATINTICGTTTKNITVKILSKVDPTFDPIPTICAGTVVPVLPSISLNGINGTWFPALISNTANGTYIFTPDLNQCATKKTINTTLSNPILPTFSINQSICAGTNPPDLPTTSINGFTGIWFPNVVNNTISGTYTFTPVNGQCASKKEINIAVKPLIIPSFNPIPAFCSGTTAPVLPTISLNGIFGTWLPITISNKESSAYTFTPLVGLCATTQTINVTVKEVLSGFQYYVSEPFSDIQNITIITNILGDFLYQLDDGVPQSSNVFQNVSSGLHAVTVYQNNECFVKITINDFIVINYPRFFTPNGDGYNDTWNINDLFLQRNSQIFIFDRYGKLIKQIFPFSTPWDGNYIGNPMPSDDYWFKVDYEYKNEKKQFKAHFTLKR